MKNKKLKLSFIVFIIMLVSVCLLLCPIVRNNILLGKYADQLYTIPLPSGSMQISQDKGVGNLYGTGNHLDFVAVIEIKTSLSESELAAYYSTKAVNVKSVEEISILGLDTSYPDTPIDHSVQQIEIIPKQQARPVYGSSKIFYKADVIDYSIDTSLFIIQIKDTHYASGWDLRTH